MEYEATFKPAMMDLVDAFGKGADTIARFPIYWEHLRSISDECFTEAVYRAIGRERTFPVVATLHGYCDRVNEEWATRQESEDARITLRLGAGDVRLPMCALCHDLGWVSRPHAAANMPSEMIPCSCGQATKGRDPGFGLKQFNAGYYHANRDSSARPEPPNAPPDRFVPDDPGEHFHQGGVPVPETREDQMKRARAAQIAKNINHVAKSMAMNAPRAPVRDPAPRDV